MANSGGYAQIGLLVLGLLLWPLLFLTVPPSHSDIEPRSSRIERNSRDLYTVTRVTDGDTITVEQNGTRDTVRILGIDAPEMHYGGEPECFARESRVKTIELLLAKQITLIADPSQGDRDAYDRLLRFIELPNGKNFSEAMLEGGYARAYVHSVPHVLHEEFAAKENEAMRQKRGLWGLCAEVAQPVV
jgi:endonuclease YncB( thermonuclease family)